MIIKIFHNDNTGGLDFEFTKDDFSGNDLRNDAFITFIKNLHFSFVELNFWIEKQRYRFDAELEESFKQKEAGKKNGINPR